VGIVIGLKQFNCAEGDVDEVVNEFAEFVDNPTIRVRFQSQLVNYSMAAHSLRLPDNLVIRRLTDREISAFYGGSLVGNLLRRNDFIGGIDEFVIEGECEAMKTFSGDKHELDETSPVNIAISKLGKAI
jgi:hypothetical protein